MSFISKYVDNRIYKALDQCNLVDKDGVSIQFDEKFKLAQNKIMYYGDTSEIIKFYKTNRPKNEVYPTNLFYRVETGNIPLLHYPLGNIITKSMVNLIFSDNPRIEGKNKKITSLIENIYKDNNISELLQKAVEYESYSGAVGFKPILDKEFSEYPILVIYPKEDIEIVKKYDRITEVIFKDYYEKKGKDYILFTICGKGYIDFKLYKDNGKGEKEEAGLNELEETSNLKRLDFFNSDGSRYNNIMAVYKENKAGAKSDYDNLIDDFAALDEVYSNMIDFIRKSRIKTYFPESLLNENAKTGEKYIKPSYDTDDIILHDSNPEGTTQEVKRDIVEVNNSLNGYKDSFNNILLNALSTAGLSPATIGLDISGANSSALALNIRERTSLRTKTEKQKRWEESLDKLTKLLLDLNSLRAVGSSVFLTPYNDIIKVTFAEYETPSFDEQVRSLGEALNNNLISLSEALKILYPGKTEEELEIMKMEIENQLPDGDMIVDKEADLEESDENITEK